MQFVANLRDRTIDAFGRHGIQPDAYLLSTHRIAPAALRHAHALREDGVPLMADNGSKALIDEVIATFRQPAAELWSRVRDLRHAVGRTPRGRDVPKALRQEASALAHEVVALATTLSARVDAGALLDAQLSMRPTHLVAQEDFGVACLLALNLERETTGWPVRSFESRNARSLRLWQRVTEDPRVSGLTVFAVLSAADYNSARAAGRLAAAAGVDHVAIGCAAFMLDPTAVDFYSIGSATFTLERPAARRYVRFAQVIAGIRDGFAEARRPLQSMHTLGLGAPAMFPLFAAAAPSGARLTTDATSPIHDAVRDRVLYDPAHHGTRLPVHRIVGSVLEGDDWPFACPFCSAFRERHGHQPGRAREAWVAAGHPAIDRPLLESDPILGSALPLFAGLDADRSASRTHVAHNHWVVGQIARQIPEGEGRQAWTARRIAELVQGLSLVVDRGLRAAVEILDGIQRVVPLDRDGSMVEGEKDADGPLARGSMEIVTLHGLADTLGRAAKAGALRSRLIGSVERLLGEVDRRMQDREQAVHEAWRADPDRLHAAFGDLAAEGDRLPTVHDIVTAALDVQRRTDALEDGVLQAFAELSATAGVDGADIMLEKDAAAGLAALRGGTLDLRQRARTMLRLFRTPPGIDVLSRRLAYWSFLRLWSLHGLVLLAIVRAQARPAEDGAAQVSADRAAVEAHVREFRDRLRAALDAIHRSSRATPASLLALWAVVHRTEGWIREHGAGLVAHGCAAATAAVDARAGDAERQARDAAILYDRVRTLLALLAGARAALRACSLLDGRALAAISTASTLPVSTATLDLPRTSVAQAAGMPEGEIVETAALVLDARVRAGGPAPRTVLRIGTPGGAQLDALLPFVAADSFGVGTGLWVQVRGAMFPNGKDDLTGPVLQVRRVQRERAAAESFFDALIWAGRHEFDLRPGQLDIVGGRRAAERRTAAELGIRR